MSGEKVTITADPATGEVSAETGDDTPIGQPSRWVGSVIWIVIILAFAIPMNAAALTLCLEFLSPGAVSDKVESSLVLLLFTTPSAFLSGLLMPSPLRR